MLDRYCTWLHPHSLDYGWSKVSVKLLCIRCIHKLRTLLFKLYLAAISQSNWLKTAFPPPQGSWEGLSCWGEGLLGPTWQRRWGYGWSWCQWGGGGPDSTGPTSGWRRRTPSSTPGSRWTHGTSSSFRPSSQWTFHHAPTWKDGGGDDEDYICLSLSILNIPNCSDLSKASVASSKVRVFLSIWMQEKSILNKNVLVDSTDFRYGLIFIWKSPCFQCCPHQ